MCGILKLTDQVASHLTLFFLANALFMQHLYGQWLTAADCKHVQVTRTVEFFRCTTTKFMVCCFSFGMAENVSFVM